MTPVRCPMASLVEARRDGRLSRRDVASLDRHLATCATCRALDAELAKIADHIRAPIAPLTPLEHQRARVALLRRAAEPSRPVARAWPLRPLALAATFAAILLALWIRPTRGPDQAHLASPTNTRTENTVLPEQGARFTRTTTAALDLVALHTGAITVGVRPLAPGERFIVRTDDADVEVRGTLFRVEATEGHILSVLVTEGKVEVRSRGTSALVLAGGSWHATPPSPADSTVDQPPPLMPSATPSTTALDAPTPTSRNTAPDAPTPTPSASIALAASPPNPSRDPAFKLAERAPTRGVAGSGAGEGTGPRSAGSDTPRRGSIPQPSSPTSTDPPSQPSRQFADALQSMERGDYSSAASRLDAFHAQNPADPRAEEATYLKAIALQRAGRPAEAADAARAYLARYPHGSFRAEATALAALAAPR